MILIKVDVELPKFFTPDELDRIIANIDDPKMSATIRLFAETGLRRSELFKCTLEDGFLHLKHTKGRRDRLVALPPGMLDDFLLATADPYHVDSIAAVSAELCFRPGLSRKGAHSTVSGTLLPCESITAQVTSTTCEGFLGTPR